MTTQPDTPEQVPGQLDLIPEPGDLEAELARIRHDQDRLTALRTEYTFRALDRIAAATAAQSQTVANLAGAVADARAVGATWEQIGKAAGMTRQAAHERWAR